MVQNPFDAQDERREMSVAVGDMVAIMDDHGNGWTYARCYQSGEIGWIPAHCIAYLPDDEKASDALKDFAVGWFPTSIFSVDWDGKEDLQSICRQPPVQSNKEIVDSAVNPAEAQNGLEEPSASSTAPQELVGESKAEEPNEVVQQRLCKEFGLAKPSTASDPRSVAASGPLDETERFQLELTKWQDRVQKLLSSNHSKTSQVDSLRSKIVKIDEFLMKRDAENSKLSGINICCQRSQPVVGVSDSFGAVVSQFAKILVGVDASRVERVKIAIASVLKGQVFSTDASFSVSSPKITIARSEPIDIIAVGEVLPSIGSIDDAMSHLQKSLENDKNFKDVSFREAEKVLSFTMHEVNCRLRLNKTNWVGFLNIVEAVVDLDERVAAFFKVVRYWAFASQLLGHGSDRISEATLVILVLHFLQIHGVIPNVLTGDAENQINVPSFSSTNHDAMPVLLQSFAMYFGMDFDWVNTKVCYGCQQDVANPDTSVYFVADPTVPKFNWFQSFSKVAHQDFIRALRDLFAVSSAEVTSIEDLLPSRCSDVAPKFYVRVPCDSNSDAATVVSSVIKESMPQPARVYSVSDAQNGSCVLLEFASRDDVRALLYPGRSSRGICSSWPLDPENEIQPDMAAAMTEISGKSASWLVLSASQVQNIRQ